MLLRALMGELLPSLAAESVKQGLLEYLETTFALADQPARAALTSFLTDPVNGLFKGPYLRLRMPFEPAGADWRHALSWWPEDFEPYGHQAAAFGRLGSGNLRPEKPQPLPTLVVTGTGSGKTESFLIPIVDHVLRAKARGETGMKALLLYPMNALANDQAQRLARLITSDARLDGVSAGLYTGQAERRRTRVTADGLINDRFTMRESAPDILLTNYKMLDQLLLRADDQLLWKQSAASLQYLVLDEFHTYDGAQGTDVAMLLRRLGLALKAYGREPLDLTPVATSATLGDKGDPATMLAFAETIFGERFEPDSVVTEERVAVNTWSPQISVGSPLTGDELAVALLDAVDSLGPDPEAATLAKTVLDVAYDDVSPHVDVDSRVRTHPLTRQLLESAWEGVPIRDLAHQSFPGVDPDDAERALAAYVGMLSHLRKEHGRGWPSVELHLWIRELTRIDREASGDPVYSWSDDGAVGPVGDEGGFRGPMLPAIYCRHCGRSGWMLRISPANETDLDLDDEGIRQSHFSGKGRTRPLIHAPGEGDLVLDGADPEDGLRWLHLRTRQMLAKAPDGADAQDGSVLPVLTHLGVDADEESQKETCPACRQRDGIRFLGSAIATQLSVSLSTIFGSTHLDAVEKKTLVFTDSVQDAAHRAGFVQSRSHSLAVRSMLRAAIGDAAIGLDLLADRVIEQAGDDRSLRFRILPPDLAEHDTFKPFWESPTLAKVPRTVRNRVRKRVAFDAALEFGLQSQFGRTLEATGTVGVEVEAAAGLLLTAARQAVEAASDQALLAVQSSDEELVAWARGVLERMRERGSIQHEWFTKFIAKDGNRHWIWRGRPRSEGMPAFPSGRSGPAFPRVGKALESRDPVLDPVTGAQAWYTDWTRRVLSVTAVEASTLVKMLLARMAHHHVIEESVTESDARVYSILPSSIVVEPLTDDGLAHGYHSLQCAVCAAHVTGTAPVVEQLTGAPCLVSRCMGRLSQVAGDPANFYRRFYAARDLQRVIAREHTSLLPDEVRLAYENGFKSSDESTPNAPNVLVATPTLEMGIDIGDLSTVMLASLPRSVASYVQRIGRGGRKDGSAFGLAFVAGRGEQLPRLGDPLSMINGEVRPPATYLNAEEILRRQYIAALADRLARDPEAPHPRTATGAMAGVDPDTWLGAIAALAETDAGALEDFLAAFGALTEDAAGRLREWCRRESGDLTSPLAQRLLVETQRWRHEVETLGHRITEVEANLSELERIAGLPAATDEDKHHYQAAVASLRLARRQRAGLQGEYWISVAERAGLLPNYTLLDDSVALDVALQWLDPETGTYETEPLEYHRNAALALRELAPRAKFYARGYRVEIDAVDLGAGGEAVRTWAFCPGCGFRTDVTSAAAPAACPRCGVEGLADVRQRIDVVELTRSSSVMRRDEAAIDDRSDQRDRTLFDERFNADIDPAKVTRQWFVAGYGFGVKHLRNLDLTWVNLGRRTSHGSTKVIAGQEIDAELFRVCSQCGKLDQGTGRNQRYEHRPWCSLRNAAEEKTVSVALSRSLTTEGLVLRLPPMTSVGNDFAVPSLEAALKLGLREHLGGAPDHLSVETTLDPETSGGETYVHDALLLHDLVPGGTGYLIDLAAPEVLRDVLQKAYDIVTACECADEGRLACHRCLLPFARPGSERSVSRAEAERQLADILASGTDDLGKSWDLTEVPVVGFDQESKLERLFRKRVTKRLAGLGASVKEQPGTFGVRYDITLGGRSWSLDPQVSAGHTVPDFVLRTTDPNVPPMAIYCDGWRFHASPAHNRIADDAEKRRLLREQGYVVVAVTWVDLDETSPLTAPGWLARETVIPLANQLGIGLKPDHVDVIAGSALDLISWWVQNADISGLRSIGTVVPFLLAAPAQVKGAVGPGRLLEAAVQVLAGKPLAAGEGTGWAWCEESLTIVCRHAAGSATEIAVIIDDSAVSPDHRATWQIWLRHGNLLGGRETDTYIGTPGVVNPSRVDVMFRSADVKSPLERTDGYEYATPAERAALKDLHEGGIELPTIGYEVEGITVLAWVEKKVALDVDLEEEDRVCLSESGWTVVQLNFDAIRSALIGGTV